MTDNPFDAEGGFDLNAMLEQAQQMQAQLVPAQEELAADHGRGLGRRRDRDAHRHRRADRRHRRAPAPSTAPTPSRSTDLGDLVVAAYRDGKAQVDALAAQALGPLAGGGLDLGGSAVAPGELPGAPAASRADRGLRCMRASSRT